jgi:hypothetical protein
MPKPLGTRSAKSKHRQKPRYYLIDMSYRKMINTEKLLFKVPFRGRRPAKTIAEIFNQREITMRLMSSISESEH